MSNELNSAPALGTVAAPSVGRIVHFFSQEQAARDDNNGMGAGPYLALVTQVSKNEDGVVTFVNLAVMPPFRETFHEGSVAHLTASHADPARYWLWPEKV